MSSSKKRAKVVIEFNEESRREFLTGFSKRKKERRKKALRELDEKARNETIATRKELRDSLGLEQRVISLRKPRDEDEEDKKVLQSFASNQDVQQLHDDFSSHAFGSASVTVTTTIPKEDEKEEEYVPASSIKLPKHAKLAQSETAKIAARLRDKMSRKRTRPNLTNSGRKPEKKDKKKKARHR